MDDEVALCVPNIGPRQRRLRLVAGLALLAVTGALAMTLQLNGASGPWRATIFPPLLVAAICLLQVRAQTCIALAARGERNLDRGTERMADGDELHAVRVQARRITIQAVVIAVVSTVVFVVLS